MESNRNCGLKDTKIEVKIFLEGFNIKFEQV
jgi:hypothetical protein